MRKITAFLFSLCLLNMSALLAQTVSIIPQPNILKMKEEGKFTISPSTVIVLEGSGLEKTAAYFNDYLQKYYLFKLRVVSQSSAKNTIRLNYQRLDKEMAGAYVMTIDDKGVYIGGDNANGTFNGVQSLIQLLPVPDARLKMRPKSLEIPFLFIEDAPRFAYRGMHLDVSRHFFPVSFIKRYIDYLALHKLNRFHWHLTDDQGWRIEIKKYPNLTKTGAWRNGTIIGRYPGTGNDQRHYGGYYTQAEIKEVVKYAADRFIEVVPEIEMPGHSSAAIAAYPQLSCFPDEPTVNYYPKDCAWWGDTKGKQVQQTWGVFNDVFCAGKDSTFIFMQDVLEEVLALFPSKYIHVGGDECPKENWKRCNRCQQRIKDEGLSDEHHLQSYFIQRIEKYLNAKGRTLIGWDEILEGGLAPNAVVMSWRGETGGIQAAQQNHYVIMTPGNPVYFDHTQSESEDSVTIGGFNPIEKVYAYDPIPAKLEYPASQYVLGAQANVWAEYMTNPRKVEYMIFPRMAALSEVLWTDKDQKNSEQFELKLLLQLKRYELWGANYSRAFFELKTSVLPTPDYNGVLWHISTKDNKGEIAVAEEQIPKSGEVYRPYTSAGEVITKSCTMIASHHPSFNDYTIIHHKQQFSFNKATGKRITLNLPASDKYPGDGAFTLVNGIQNTKGFARSREFLGFNGTNCEADIDLGQSQSVSEVTIHTLHQAGSWIWRPLSVQVWVMDASGNYVNAGLSDDFVAGAAGSRNGTMKVRFPAVNTHIIRIKIENWGQIPAGEPGSGNKPWLFVDEIEVN